MKEQKDLEQMYRRFSEQAERVPLPTEEQLLELIRQQPQVAAEPKSVRVPLQPTRRSCNTHMWRYAASVLLVVSVGLVAWLMTRPQPAPMVADKQTPAPTPAGNTLTNDSALGDSLVPAVMPLVNYEEVLMATQPHTQQLTPQADDTAAGVRVPLPMETYDGGLLSDEVAPIARRHRQQHAATLHARLRRTPDDQGKGPQSERGGRPKDHSAQTTAASQRAQTENNP